MRESAYDAMVHPKRAAAVVNTHKQQVNKYVVAAAACVMHGLNFQTTAIHDEYNFCYLSSASASLPTNPLLSSYDYVSKLYTVRKGKEKKTCY